MTEPTHAELLARWHRDSARRAVRRAIKAGRLVVPATCSSCGKKRKLQAHHGHGYDDPLDVAFLCQPCHDVEHHGVEKLRIRNRADALAVALRARRMYPNAFTAMDRRLDGLPSLLGPELSDAEQKIVDEISR
jgi:hypothetical protein